MTPGPDRFSNGELTRSGAANFDRLVPRDKGQCAFWTAIFVGLRRGLDTNEIDEISRDAGEPPSHRAIAARHDERRAGNREATETHAAVIQLRPIKNPRRR